MEKSTKTHRILRLQEAMAAEYHGVDITNLPTDVSGKSTQNRPSGLKSDLISLRRQLNPLDGDSASRYITKIVKLEQKNVANNDGVITYDYFFGSDSVNTHNGELVPNKPKKAEIESLLYGGVCSLKDLIAGDVSQVIPDNTWSTKVDAVQIYHPFLGSGTLKGTPTYKGLSVFAESAGAAANKASTQRRSVFYQKTYSSTGVDLQKQKDWDGDFSGTRSSFFIKRLGVTSEERVILGECKLEDSVNPLDKAPWVYTLDATKSTYNAKDGNTILHPSENEDVSGQIKISVVADGRYHCVYVEDGDKLIEIPETVVDIACAMKEPTEVEMTYDLSKLPQIKKENSDIIADSIDNNTKNSRNNISNFDVEKTNVETVKVDNFIFYRIGSVIRFAISKSHLDYDTNPCMKLPKLLIKTKGDIDGKCDKEYNLNLILQDVTSCLDISGNRARSWKSSSLLDWANPNTSEDKKKTFVSVSRWSEMILPIDISGFLEQGECFKLKLEADKYIGSDKNINNGSGSGDAATEFNIGTAAYDKDNTGTTLPLESSACAFKLEYRNTNSASNTYTSTTDWTCTDGVEFCYECHDKDATCMESRTTDGLGGSSDANGMIDRKQTDNKKRSFSKSSNVKGMPRFRLKLPSQYHIMGQTSGEGFTSLLRKVNIVLCMKPKDGSWKELATSGREGIFVLIHGDAYNANISYSNISYDVKTDAVDVIDAKKKVIDATYTSPGALLSLTYDKHTDAQPLKYIGLDTTVGSNGMASVPAGNGKYVAYDASAMDWMVKQTGLTGNDVDFSGVDVTINENHNVEAPISIICIDEYYSGAGNNTKFDIVPLFQKMSHYEQWSINNDEYCMENSVASTRDLAATKPLLIPANTAYEIKKFGDVRG
jgi:hypothetical protein